MDTCTFCGEPLPATGVATDEVYVCLCSRRWTMMSDGHWSTKVDTPPLRVPTPYEASMVPTPPVPKPSGFAALLPPEPFAESTAEYVSKKDLSLYLAELKMSNDTVYGAVSRLRNRFDIPEPTTQLEVVLRFPVPYIAMGEAVNDTARPLGLRAAEVISKWVGARAVEGYIIDTSIVEGD